MKNALIVMGWLLAASSTFIVSLTTIHFLTKPRLVQAEVIAQGSRRQPILSYKNFVSTIFHHQNSIESADARPLLIAAFLEHYNSPLKPYDHFGAYFVQIADEYGLDYRLLPSIAMQESGLCKAIPAGSFNCLGLGVHSQGTWHFDTFEANFAAAAKILRQNYVDDGLITPEQIQSRYTPSSNGSWQRAVNHFMNEIESGEFD